MPHLIANTVLIPEMAQLIREGRSVNFTPGGVSMRPFIEGGKDSVVLVQPTNLRVGDVILAQITDDRYVLHRLIKIEGEHVTLMGDGNIRGTEQCDVDHVIAKVQSITSPKGHRKPVTRGRVWYYLLPLRRYLLKIYRHTPRIL